MAVLLPLGIMLKRTRFLAVLGALVAGLAIGGGGAGSAVAADAQRIVGFADVHNHQFANLGFGGLLVWGAPFDPDGDISKALPWSDWTPAAPGDVVGPDGNPVVVGCPNPFILLFKCTLTSPATGASCPPGTDILHQCAGVWVHGPGGVGDLLHFGSGHLVGGFPEFNGWPRWNILTGQQVYVDWLKRAHDGGLKLMVMLAVNNEVLCGVVNHIASFGCEDMPAVDRQVQAAKDLEAFVDAQNGGPGKGWYRIARSGAEAREIINSGKLAVVLGVEVDNLFGCNKQPARRPTPCTPAFVRSELQRYYDMGVRHVFPIHLTDNAFGGMALYNDLFDISNKLATGDWWDVKTCDETSGIDFHLDEIDKIRQPGFLDFKSQLERVLLDRITGVPPAPPLGPNCNVRGLTSLGEDLIKDMIAKGMIIDVDHASADAFDRMLTLAEQAHYPGVVSGHTGMIETGKTPHVDGDEYKRHEGNKTDAQLERIRAVGGVAAVILHQGKRSEIKEYQRPDGSTPVPFFCGNSSEAWAQVYLYAAQKMKGGAVGIGSDFNGLAGEPAPRFGPDGPLSGEACNGDRPDAYAGPPRPRVSYPFNAFGTQAELDRMQIGNNTFDISLDGLGNVGMFPDFVEELRKVGVTDAELGPLFDSAEAYVHMWERAGDRTPPSITCEGPDGVWHAADVQLSCTAEDVASGLQRSGDARFMLSTNVPDGTDTANAETSTKAICDVRANCATAGPITGNKIDKKAPLITIKSPAPEGGVFDTTGVKLQFSGDDGPGGSGIKDTSATLDGAPATNGQTLDLFLLAPGVHTIVATATDNVDHGSVETRHFEVHATSESLRTNVDRACNDGLITSRLTCNTLATWADLAVSAHQLGAHTAEAGMLRGFINELEILPGDDVDSATAERLIAFARDLIQRDT